MATTTGTTKSAHIDNPVEMAPPTTVVIKPDTQPAANDNDHEGPVREKLKKTSIGTLPKHQTENAGVQGDKMDMSQAEAPVERSSLKSLEPHPDGGDGNLIEGSEILGKTQEESDMQIAIEKSRPSKDLTDNGLHSSDQEEGNEGTGRSEEVPPSVKLEGSHQNSDSTASDSTGHVETMDEDLEARTMPPRRKRSRDQFDNDDAKESEKPTAGEDPDSRRSEDTERDTQAGNHPGRTAREEPEKKRHRDISQGSVSSMEASVSKIPSTSGFSNTSTTSPFGTLGTTSNTGSASVFGRKASTEAKPPPTSFAASGFGALSGSTTSPFGALGGIPTASSGFGSLAASGDKGSLESHTDAPSSKNVGGFGGSVLSAPSAFGGEASGFGKLGAGLSGGFGTVGGKLTSFASKEGSGIIGLNQGPVKRFGAPAEEGDEEEEGDSEDQDSDGEQTAASKELKEDRRFHHQEIETGEEGEETRFSTRAKLYFFDSAGKAWRERGIGMLKLNISSSAPDEDSHPDEEVDQEEKADETSQDEGAPPKRLARLLMRSEGVYRVVLNVPIFKGMKAGDQNGNVPSDRCIKFTAFEDGKHVMMQLRFNNNATAAELWRQIKDVQEEL